MTEYNKLLNLDFFHARTPLIKNNIKDTISEDDLIGDKSLNEKHLDNNNVSILLKSVSTISSEQKLINDIGILNQYNNDQISLSFDDSSSSSLSSVSYLSSNSPSSLDSLSSSNSSISTSSNSSSSDSSNSINSGPSSSDSSNSTNSESSNSDSSNSINSESSSSDSSDSSQSAITDFGLRTWNKIIDPDTYNILNSSPNPGSSNQVYITNNGVQFAWDSTGRYVWWSTDEGDSWSSHDYGTAIGSNVRGRLVIKDGIETILFVEADTDAEAQCSWATIAFPPVRTPFTVGIRTARVGHAYDGEPLICGDSVSGGGQYGKVARYVNGSWQTSVIFPSGYPNGGWCSALCKTSNGTYVAGCTEWYRQESWVRTSSNFSTWSSDKDIVNSGQPSDYRSLLPGPGGVVIGLTRGPSLSTRRYSLNNGDTWTQESSNNPPIEWGVKPEYSTNTGLYYITAPYGNGNTTIWTSPDGINWTSHDLSPNIPGEITDATIFSLIPSSSSSSSSDSTIPNSSSSSSSSSESSELSFLVNNIPEDYGLVAGVYTTDGTLAYLDFDENYWVYASTPTPGGTHKLYINQSNPNARLVWCPFWNQWVIVGQYYESGCGYRYGSDQDPTPGTWYEGNCWGGPADVSLI